MHSGRGGPPPHRRRAAYHQRPDHRRPYQRRLAGWADRAGHPVRPAGHDGLRIDLDVATVGLLAEQPPLRGGELVPGLLDYSDDLLPDGSSPPAATPDVAFALGDTPAPPGAVRVVGSGRRARVGRGITAEPWRGTGPVGAMAAAGAAAVEGLRAAVPWIAEHLQRPVPQRPAGRCADATAKLVPAAARPTRDGCSRPYRPLRRPNPQINAHRGVERPRSVITPEWHPHDTHRPRRTERRERRSSRSTGQQPVDVARPKGVEPPNLLIRRAIGAPARMAAKTVSGSRSMVTILIPSPGPAMGDQWETGCPETVRKSTTRCGMPSASAPAKTSRGGIKRWPAIFKTLNPRVRGSSPWRRTHNIPNFHAGVRSRCSGPRLFCVLAVGSDRFHGGGYGRGGVRSDRDPDGEVLAEAVVAQVEVERVVDVPLLIFRESAQVDIALGKQIQHVDIHGSCRLFLTDQVGEELLLLPLFANGGGESALDPATPRLVDIRVSGWL